MLSHEKYVSSVGQLAGCDKIKRPRISYRTNLYMYYQMLIYYILLKRTNDSIYDYIIS